MRLLGNQYLAARSGVLLFALVVFTQLSIAQDSDNRCGFSDRSAAGLRAKVAEGVQQLRPSLPSFLDSPSGRFRVHYTTVGSDAVPASDVNMDGVPDFVEECVSSLELAWRVEVDTLGYLPPPSDGGKGGNDAIDMYLRDLSKAGPGGSSYYGVTSLDTRLQAAPSETYSTWIEADNDFAESDRDARGNASFATFGIDALRVTCAHEFHHVLQCGRYGIAGNNRSLYELTSTWMEIRTWPGVRDWAAYTSRLLLSPEQWPLSDESANTGYVWGWFGNALAAAHPDILRSMWELIATNMRSTTALVEACKKHSTTLSSVFCSSLQWLYRTGSRGAGNPLLPGAELLPEIRYFSDRMVEPPTTTELGRLVGFEVRAFRFSVPSSSSRPPVSVGIVACDADEAGYANQGTGPDGKYRLEFTDAPSGSDLRIEGTRWGVRIESAYCSFVEGAQTVSLSGPYPQPLSLQRSRRVYIPIANESLGTRVTLSLLTLSGVALQSTTATVVLDDDRIVAPFDLDGDLAPGTYLVRAETTRASTLTKVLLQR